MTLSKEPHYAEMHHVPDDYKFTAEELQCIINGDMFTNRQGAIMARELLELRERSEPVAWMKRSIREAENWDSVDPEFVKSPEGWMSDYLPLYAAPPAPVVPDCLQRLLKHAEGLTFGSDWNNGTAAKYHRDALIQAVKDCRAAMQGKTEPLQATALPAELRDAINRLLDSDGSRGTFSAVRSYDAREELERLLAAAPAPAPGKEG